MRKRLTAVLGVALVAGLLPSGIQALADAPCVPVGAPSAPDQLVFGEKIFIDRGRAGGEPVAVVADDGSISVSAHAGTTHIYKDPAAVAGVEDFALGYANQTLNWRSVDGGLTWEYVGTAGLSQGPHSLTSTGFSDPDFAKDDSGRLYNVEIDLANVAVFSSLDDGQSWTFANPLAASGDRPWIMGGAEDEVFLYVNLPKQLWRSTDGGLTFLPVGIGGDVPIKAKPYRDPLEPEGQIGMIGPVGQQGIAISDDGGVPGSWETYNGADLGKNQDFFGVIAVDADGTVYRAAAGGYDGSGDTTPDGEVTFNWFDRTTERWGDAVMISDLDGTGDALWPWMVAGDDGRAAVTWYQNSAEAPQEFHIFVAATENAHGTVVDCVGGGTDTIPPQFSVARATTEPIHVGDICQAGTACNAETSPQGGDRRLGDFFTVNYDKDGTLFVVSGDTTLTSPTGGPKPVANPIFIKATQGPSMLEEPMVTRPTRCLYPLGDLGLCEEG